MAKISIIIPVYNTAQYLKKCLDSVINQTLKDIEIIILNDGSTDNSDSIIKNYNDNRIKYIDKKNDGIAITRNLGINISTGKYITFVDSDDYIDVTFCEKMYEKAEKEKCDIIICDYYNSVNKNIKKRSLISFRNTKLKDNPKIINEINLGPCNKIYLSSLIKETKILFPVGIKYEDAPFVCESLVKAKNIGKIDEPLSYFNIHEGSQTTIRDEKILDIFKVMNQIKEILNEKIVINNLNLLLITIMINYLVQSRYIQSNKIRNKFIDLSYKYLENIPEWKKSEYFIDLNWLKGLIIKNKLLMKIYSFFYINS